SPLAGCPGRGGTGGPPSARPAPPGRTPSSAATSAVAPANHCATAGPSRPGRVVAMTSRIVVDMSTSVLLFFDTSKKYDLTRDRYALAGLRRGAGLACGTPVA